MQKLNLKLENIANDVGGAAHSDQQKRNNCRPVGTGIVFAQNKGITLIALIITMVAHCDNIKKNSNINSFLLSSI